MEKAQPQRLGFYGGSFDPVHLGHLIVAQDAFEQAKLDRLFLVPTAQSPLKDKAPRATDQQRLEMLRLALEDRKDFELLPDEVERAGVSYTIDTVERLRERWPAAELFWIIGADQVEQLPDWHRIDELITQVCFICVSRPGYSLTVPSGIPEDRLVHLAERQIPISSTEIRQHCAEGKPVDFFLPPAVTAYIQKYELYAG